MDGSSSKVFIRCNGDKDKHNKIWWQDDSSQCFIYSTTILDRMALQKNSNFSSFLPSLPTRDTIHQLPFAINESHLFLLHLLTKYKPTIQQFSTLANILYFTVALPIFFKFSKYWLSPNNV
jgi:hypothetical protein